MPCVLRPQGSASSHTAGPSLMSLPTPWPVRTTTRLIPTAPARVLALGSPRWSPQPPSPAAPPPQGSSMVKGNPPQCPTPAKRCHFFPIIQSHLPHFIAERTLGEKKLERHHHVVYPAPQVSFATSCLTHAEKFQTPTHASITSMREKLGIEMGARSLDIFPHTHSLGSKYTGI